MKVLFEYMDNGEQRFICSPDDSTPSPTPVTTPVVVPTTPTTGLVLKRLEVPKTADAPNGQKIVNITVTGGSGNYKYQLGEKSYNGTTIFMPPSITWNIEIFDVHNESSRVSLEVKSLPVGEGLIKDFNDTVVPSVVAPTPIETPTVVPQTPTPVSEIIPSPTPIFIPKPSGYQKDSAEIGKEYTCTEQIRLHMSTHNDSNDAQYYNVKKDGELLYESFGEAPKIVYNGNHPQESQIPISDGVYQFYFKNLSHEPCIVGVTTGDPYEIYNVGGLAKAKWWKKLHYNEEGSAEIYLEEICDRDMLKGSWDGKTNNFFVTRPFYENGILCTDKMEAEGRPNGLELPENGITDIKFFSLVDRNKYIVIQFITSGINPPARFKVLEKNGLDIDPNHFMVTCYNTSYGKVFNNRCEGYGDCEFID